MTRNRNRMQRSAKRTAQGALRQTGRTLNRITNISLNNIGPNGGTIGYSTLLNPLSAFAGYDSLVNQYEQFCITGFQVYARPDTANQSQVPPQGRVAAIYTAANNTTISTYVDYDSTGAPNEQAFLGRDAMKIRSLRGGEFRLIATYRPRCRLSDATNSLPAVVNHSQWINTAYADLDWLGLAIRSAQDSPFWGTDASDCMKVQLFIKAHVRFRGLKKPDSSVSLANPITQSPSALTTTNTI